MGNSFSSGNNVFLQVRCRSARGLRGTDARADKLSARLAVELALAGVLPASRINAHLVVGAR
jgi:hypothetical protein